MDKNPQDFHDLTDKVAGAREPLLAVYGELDA